MPSAHSSESGGRPGSEASTKLPRPSPQVTRARGGSGFQRLAASMREGDVTKAAVQLETPRVSQ